MCRHLVHFLVANEVWYEQSRCNYFHLTTIGQEVPQLCMETRSSLKGLVGFGSSKLAFVDTKIYFPVQQHRLFKNTQMQVTKVTAVCTDMRIMAVKEIQLKTVAILIGPNFEFSS